MTKREMITHLHKAVKLIRKVNEATMRDQSIHQQYSRDIDQAKDICIDLANHLMALIEMEERKR